MIQEDILHAALTERVLDRLGLSSMPAIDEQALTTIYRRWCQNIPFDNILKRIQACTGAAGPLPGVTASDFFETWLATGAGGTCWAGNGALYVLLKTLGFPVRRGMSTMIAPPHRRVPGPTPRHGTVIVDLGGVPMIVDATIMHDRPLRLEAAQHEHAVWGTAVHFDGGNWHIRWTPLGRPSVDCRIEELDVSRASFDIEHEVSRGLSRFNQAVICRIARADRLEGIVRGHKVVRAADGSETFTALDTNAMRHLLVEEFGIAEQVAAGIPDNDTVNE